MTAKNIPTEVSKSLKELADKEKARQLRGYFKTRRGEYAEGDKFLGVLVPEQRLIAKKYYASITLGGISQLMKSVFHEVRHTALLMLVEKMEKAQGLRVQELIVDCYLKNIDYVDSWDLVDVSAPPILGKYLFSKDKGMLYDFAAVGGLWKQRIALLTTLFFIRQHHFDDTLAICEMLLDHGHDLIQKTMGWMLREVSKRDMEAAKQFLDKYAATMPRITLRYAIEKFTEEDKAYYMALKP